MLLVGLGVIYIRYQSVHQLCRVAGVTCINRFTFAVGILSILGIMIVGAFQVHVWGCM